MVKKFLDDNQVTYADLDVSTDDAAKEEMLKLTGRMAVPVIVVDGAVTVGFDQADISRKLGI